jgi:hypothetical protein
VCRAALFCCTGLCRLCISTTCETVMYKPAQSAVQLLERSSRAAHCTWHLISCACIMFRIQGCTCYQGVIRSLSTVRLSDLRPCRSFLTRDFWLLCKQQGFLRNAKTRHGTMSRIFSIQGINRVLIGTSLMPANVRVLMHTLDFLYGVFHAHYDLISKFSRSSDEMNSSEVAYRGLVSVFRP